MLRIKGEAFTPHPHGPTPNPAGHWDSFRCFLELIYEGRALRHKVLSFIEAEFSKAVVVIKDRIKLASGN